MKRTKYDAPAPIVKPCSVDTSAIWGRKKTVSTDLESKVLKTLLNTPARRDNCGQRFINEVREQW